MASLTLRQMEEACKKQFNTLLRTIVRIASTLEDSGTDRGRNVDDLRELSGKIKVFLNGKLKQLDELIAKLKEIEVGEKPQTQPPLFINDVQGYYDLTMIEARNIEKKINQLLPAAAATTRDAPQTSSI